MLGRFGVRLVVAALSATLCTTCVGPVDWQKLCPPTDGRVGFLSRGDCVLTRDAVFAGHEWLTFFGNEDNDLGDRFTKAEIDLIVEGNRRVDFPLELLVHLNNGLIAYVNALTEYHDLRENQPVHFLLNDTNASPEASADAHELVQSRTREAVSIWRTDRTRALTLLGQVTHCIQDSFSAAHTRRDPGHAEPWCIVKVKAYMPRAPGFMTEGIEFHGGTDEGDTVGHATPNDSITMIDDDPAADEACRAPETQRQIRDCLTDTAVRAKDVTGEYLRLAHRWAVDGAVDEVQLDGFIARNLSLCSDAPGI